ncbi:MAG: hypothetical protein LBB10_00825 [Bifidobacteriaceae bacterium]|nr:hypothetical protein [Bifidobacteriaceae bacterium]
MKKVYYIIIGFISLLPIIGGAYGFANVNHSYADDSTSATKTKYDPILISSQITDPNNLLAADKPQILSIFQKAQEQSNIKVYCIFVPDFSNPPDPDAWIDQTAAMSNLDSQSVLFAVATQSGKTAIFIPKNSEKLSKRNLETVSPSVVQLLSVSAWSEAVIEFTKEITAQADANSLSPFIIAVITLIIIGAIAGLLYLFIFRKKLQKSKDKPKRLKRIETVPRIE